MTHRSHSGTTDRLMSATAAGNTAKGFDGIIDKKLDGISDKKLDGSGDQNKQFEMSTTDKDRNLGADSTSSVHDPLVDQQPRDTSVGGVTSSQLA